MIKFVVITAAAFAIAGAASAATFIDFTDATRFDGKQGEADFVANTVYPDFSFTLSTNPAESLNFRENGGAGGNASTGCANQGGMLACDNDGLGIANFEVTNFDPTQLPPLQSVTIDFDKRVKLLGFKTLDLFMDPNSDDTESVKFYLDGDISTLTEFVAVETFQNNGGFADFALNTAAFNSITFFAGEGNDGQGNSDFALAALDIQVVPLPAAAWMLLGALGGLSMLSRRRTA